MNELDLLPEPRRTGRRLAVEAPTHGRQVFQLTPRILLLAMRIRHFGPNGYTVGGVRYTKMVSPVMRTSADPGAIHSKTLKKMNPPTETTTLLTLGILIEPIARVGAAAENAKRFAPQDGSIQSDTLHPSSRRRRAANSVPFSGKARNADSDTFNHPGWLSRWDAGGRPV